MDEYCTRGNPVDWVTCDGTWGFDDCDDFSLPVSVWDEAIKEQSTARREADSEWLAGQWLTRPSHRPPHWTVRSRSHLSLVPPVDK